MSGIETTSAANLTASDRSRKRLDWSHHLRKSDVAIELLRGSLVKRGSTGRVDFISPFPCPFDYHSIHDCLGLEGDWLDAVVLGPRLPLGSRVSVRAFGAVGLTDCGLYADKLFCCFKPLRNRDRWMVPLFFQIYAKCNGLLIP